MKDKLRSPFRNPHPTPGLKGTAGTYDKVPMDKVDQPGTNFVPTKTFEDIGPKTTPNSAQSHQMEKVRIPMRSNVSKG